MRRVAWGNYTNARFRYTIRYPRDFLIPQALGQTLAQFETDTVSRLTKNSGIATCRRRHPTWFAVSGVTADKIFFAKTILACDIQKSFEFTYPREKADVDNAVTASIASRFRSLGTGR